MPTLTALPVEILILVLETLGLHEMTALCLTCHSLNSLVTEYGWSIYLRSNPRPSCSLSKARSLWSPYTRVRYDVLSDAAWTEPEFIARPLSRAWPGNHQPILAISPSRLIVGVGSNLCSYRFGTSPSPSAAPPVSFEGAVSLSNTSQRPRNITALTFIDDGGLDCTLNVAFQDGAMERVRLWPVTNNKNDITAPSLSCTRDIIAPIPEADFIESFSTQSGTILSLSANGTASLTATNLSSASASASSTISLKSRSWVSLLSLTSSTPYAAFGCSSTTPLAVHALTSAGELSPRPLALLHTKKGADLPFDQLPASAVYGIAQGPLNSPWGASPQIVVSGWYDGQVRVYDLRSSSRASPSPSPSPGPNDAPGDAPTRPPPAPLRPVLSLADRWSYEPIYSVACGGGSAAHIAAGTARHSVVSFWDVRAPGTGWSVHAPGNDPSPVYSVVLESSRFFGVTQSRPFVYDFGPDVSLDTYPALPQVRGIDNLKHKKGSNRATYHTLRYAHNSSGLCHEH
ncbi:hypothetical protein CVT25_009333 [Psilocybe cyanescens]|uniref:F-box domain-containing protein n=1 Tax=Psilocybe cyanescens TaxID=93625 RepID=A0A409VNB0_PSICY|nr:hypothetical protein CVT25_009333 [Psilocybe cyanescens]